MFRSAADEHLIDQGRVYCPLRRRDVEFDLCAGCRCATSIDLKSKPPVVHCDPALTHLSVMHPWL